MLLLLVCLTLTGCGGKKTENYILNESTFFLVMTNMLYYPEQYANSEIELDCFTYDLVDVDGVSHICGVRKCSSGYGCTCGRDTIIGFILESDAALPAPRNQSEDNGDKTWVHLKGRLKSPEKSDITIPAYRADGTIDPGSTEKIQLLVFTVESCEQIEDASGLAYYVTK